MATETVCRLCSFSCDEFKCLFENEGETEIYKISSKYFSRSLLHFGVICTDCWQHIFNFHSFQQWIVQAQENEMNLNEILCEEISSGEKNIQNEAELSTGSLNRNEKNRNVTNPFECETCGASFTLYGNLRRHMRKKHKLQPLRTWTCLDCNKVFKNRSNFERHKKQVHSNTDSKKDIIYDENENSEDTSTLSNENVSRETRDKTEGVIETSLTTIKVLCSPESEIKANESKTELDLQIHLPPLDIVDINDGMSTDSESYLNANDSSALISPMPLKADTDKENILAYDNLIAEQKSHLECPKCEKHLTNFSMLNEHFQSEHSEESCYIVCCDEPLYDRRSIVEHLEIHENPSAFNCSKCGKEFKNSRGLNSHNVQVHSESRSAYHLHLCYCKRAKELHADKVKEQNIEYDTFVCCQRKKKILEDDALIAEWKKTLKCFLCNLTFPYYSLMRVHFYLEHPGEKCYISCCDRKISRISDAIEHIRVHLDPKIYQCKACKVMFSSRSSLLKHMRVVHYDLLPKQKWACNECDKTFKIRQILIRHKNVYHSKKV